MHWTTCRAKADNDCLTERRWIYDRRNIAVTSAMDAPMNFQLTSLKEVTGKASKKVTEEGCSGPDRRGGLFEVNQQSGNGVGDNGPAGADDTVLADSFAGDA